MAEATPRISIRCEYPDTSLEPTTVTFGLSPRYGIHNTRDAHEWFFNKMAENEVFEVETDKAGAPPLTFWSGTVQQVVVDWPTPRKRPPDEGGP